MHRTYTIAGISECWRLPGDSTYGRDFTNMRRRGLLLFRFTAATLLGLLPPQLVRAQEITVEASGGLRSDTQQKTALEFSTSTGETLNVNRIVETMTSTTGHSASDYVTLCATPCKLSVEPGFYKLRMGNSHMFDPVIDLNVNGGRRSFEVTPSRPGYFLLGILLSTAGLCLTATGFLQEEGSYADGTKRVTTMGKVLGFTGLGIAAAGFVLGIGFSKGAIREAK